MRKRDQGNSAKVTKGYRLPADLARAVDVHAAELGVRPCVVVESLLRRHLPGLGVADKSIVGVVRNKVK